jgi:Na+-driven multidrug efflux pump
MEMIKHKPCSEFDMRTEVGPLAHGDQPDRPSKVVSPKTIRKLSMEGPSLEAQANLPESTTFKSFSAIFLKKSFPISIMRALPFLQNIFFFYFIGMFQDRDMISGYGLCCSSMAFFNIVQAANAAECSGVYSSKFLGASKYSDMRLSYYRGLGIMVLNFIISLIFFARLDLILVAIGFTGATSEVAWKGVLFLVPYMMVQNYCENLRVYMITLDFDRVFNFTNAFELVGGVVLGWYFVWYLKLGILGIGVSRLILESVTCLILLLTWKKWGMAESFKKDETFRQMFLNQNFWNFIKFWIKMTVPIYTEYLGFELMTIFSGIYGDQDVTSSWVACQSVMSCVFTMGIGFADTSRVFVGYQIGKKNFKFAKKLACWGIILHFLAMMVPNILISVFSDDIASIFTDIPSVHKILSLYLFIYGFIAPFDCLMYNFGTIFRLTGSITF